MNRECRMFRLVWLAMACLGLTGAGMAFAEPETVWVSVGQSREIGPDFMGYNENFMGQTDPFGDSPIGRMRKNGLIKIDAAAFRYPAGTVGSYWNWRTGRLDESLNPGDVMSWVRPFLNGAGRYTPYDFQKALDHAGLRAVWMLGMAVHGVDEQIEILREMQAKGIEIRYLELGNEVIFDRVEPLLERQFPTAERYGEIASEWIAKLHEAFPGCLVAACGSFVNSAGNSERRREWNPRMMTTLRGADAITMHLFARDLLRELDETAGLDEVERQNRPIRAENAAADDPAEAVRLALGRAHRLWPDLRRFSKTPDSMHIWVTEWNAAGIGAGAMPWAEALGTAAVLDSYLRDGRVTMQCYHTFSDAAGIPRGRAAAQTAGDGAALPPLGQVLALFGKAMRGMTQAAPLAFSPDETISAAGDPRHPYPLRFGWVFENEQAARAIVANLSEQPVRLRSAESASGARVRMLAADALAAAPAVEAVESQIGDSLDMPPWSIALVEAANGGR